MSTLGLTTVELALFGATVALLLWLALAFLLLASRRRNHWLKRFGLMVVVGAGAVYWTISAGMRITGTVDAILLTDLSRMWYALFAFYAVSFGYLNWRVPRDATP